MWILLSDNAQLFFTRLLHFSTRPIPFFRCRERLFLHKYLVRPSPGGDSKKCAFSQARETACLHKKRLRILTPSYPKIRQALPQPSSRCSMVCTYPPSHTSKTSLLHAYSISVWGYAVKKRLRIMERTRPSARHTLPQPIQLAHCQ